MNKADLRDLLTTATKQFEDAGNEVVRYASLSSCDVREKIQLGVHHKVHNLKQEEWENYLKEVENGTYQADTFKQEPMSRTKERFALIRG